MLIVLGNEIFTMQLSLPLSISSSLSHVLEDGYRALLGKLFYSLSRGSRAGGHIPCKEVNVNEREEWKSEEIYLEQPKST